MNDGQLELFLKLVVSDYALSAQQVEVLRSRMLADEAEFTRVWDLYKLKARKTKKGVDGFLSTLKELLS